MDGSIIIIIDNHTSKNFNMKLKTWGTNYHSGVKPCSSIKITTEAMEQWQVVRVFGASEAFAALCRDGSVFCWGDPHRGGDMREKAIFRAELAALFFVFVLRLKELYIMCTQK